MGEAFDAVLFQDFGGTWQAGTLGLSFSAVMLHRQRMVVSVTLQQLSFLLGRDFLSRPENERLQSLGDIFSFLGKVTGALLAAMGGRAEAIRRDWAGN